MITIDGSFGEGGGQIVRSSLALSMVTGKPVRIEKIRAGRRRPGLMRQHLTAVQAAAEVSQARVEGAAIASSEVVFRPGAVLPGEYEYAIGTAGSTTLVLQTVLPALLTASGASRLTFEGGTHNPFAPPFDFLAKSFIPLVNRMGPTVSVELERPGFYPAGGGRLTLTVEPVKGLEGFELLERGAIINRAVRAIVANLPRSIAERETRVIRSTTGWDDACFSVEEVARSPGPGNVVLIEITAEHVTEVFSAFGEKGRPAETVAMDALQACQRWLEADVPVGVHLADQLLLPLALAGAGQFTTLAPSRHTTTHVELVRRFLDIGVSVDRWHQDHCLVRIA